MVARVDRDLDRHGVPRRRRHIDRQPELLCQEGAEVAADDLRGRPPERLGVDDGGPPLVLAPEVAGVHPGEQQAPQDGLEGSRADGRARVGRDRARNRVGLLGGDSALFDGEVGDVAGRLDVAQSEHPAELVGGDEAGLVLR